MEKVFVLLADDNEAVCTLVTALLQKDFNVDVVASGSEAVKRLQKRRYAAVILDLALAGGSGFTVLEAITAQWPALLPHVLVLAAQEGSRELQRARAHGVCSVMNKPLDLETLVDAVKRCASSSGPLLHAPLVSSSMLLLLADFLHHSRLM